MLSRYGFLILSICWLTGCELRQAMYNQPKLKPLAKSDFFKDGMGSRPIIEGTVPRGHLEDDELLYKGMEGGKLSDRFPYPMTEADLRAGKTQFEIFCSVCHGHAGHANGMIVQRGFKKPPSLHEDRLIGAPVGHFFNVIKNGINTMPAYGKMIPVTERWQIVAYIRALQLSQNAKASDLSAEQRAELDKPATSKAGVGHGDAHGTGHGDGHGEKKEESK